MTSQDERIAELEAENTRLRSALEDASGTLGRCISACVERRGASFMRCLVCRIEAALSAPPPTPQEQP